MWPADWSEMRTMGRILDFSDSRIARRILTGRRIWVPRDVRLEYGKSSTPLGCGFPATAGEFGCGMARKWPIQALEGVKGDHHPARDNFLVAGPELGIIPQWV